YDFVRAEGTGVLASDNPLNTPDSRARAFLAAHGGLFGMSDAERQALSGTNAAVTTNATTAATLSMLQLSKVSTDRLGMTHARFRQTYRGLNVFGAQLVVHMDKRGIRGVNGGFVPDVKVVVGPGIGAAAAGQSALATLRKEFGNVALGVAQNELSVYRAGLLEGYRGPSVLAYGVKVSDAAGPLEQVWLEAETGAVLNRIPLRHSALNRRVYSPKYDSSNPNLFVVRKEEDLVPVAGPFEDLFQFSGHTYRLLSSGFGRDSYDGLGSVMRAVYLVNSVCPNAYWDGQTTNYCPEIDADDVVAHEWGHGYTQFTHDLVYSFQSGALNESYSDVFGESVDLLNGVDGEGGTNNGEPTQYDIVEGKSVVSGGGVRWRIGEDVSGVGQPAAGILRDMWTPTAFGNPDKVSSEFYQCDPGDGGGVHTNSNVPNHAFALLVDGTAGLPGGESNGQSIEGIGLTRALHIYYRAMTVYQTPTTNFAQHEQALRASCQDLIGQPLNALSTTTATGTASGETITAATCEEVGKAMAAVEMSRPPTQCNFGPLLDPSVPADCDGAADIFTEDFETGLDGWTLASAGSFAGWPNYNWVTDSTLPAARAGAAAFAFGGSGGVCGDPNGDRSGKFSMDTPTISVPAGATSLKLSFEHFVASEFLVDGGNVLVSKNGGAFTLVPQESYLFNAPTGQLRPAPPVDQNTNPKAGEMAWSGADPEVGAFGTTILDLSTLVAPGDTFRVRFEFGLDGCGGNQGWYVDHVRVFDCPVLAPPVLSVGSAYENPDTDGSFGLTWTRPAGATGPDTLQESTSCAPLFTDDAEGGLTKWDLTTTGTGASNWESSTTKPQHDSTAFWARATENATNASAIMTTKTQLTLPTDGATTLRFSDWDVNEGDDTVSVEVSEDGQTWDAVYTHVRSEQAPFAAEFFGTEELFRRQADLTRYHGKSVYLRFRYTVGAENRPASTPFGWYVDDIAITNDDWTNVASGLTQSTYTLTGKPDGNFCYRVKTAYTFGAETVESPFSNVVNATVVNNTCLTNVAASSNGATAVASSTASSRNYTPAGAIDGDHVGAGWETGGGWNDNTRDLYPDWLQVNLGGAKRVSQIRVYTLQDDFSSPQEPTPFMMATNYGLLDFEVQTWNGSQWVTVPGGNITGNTLVMRTLVFPEVTTDKLRVLVTNAREHFSRIVEVEAIGCSAP
ncbi:MAG: M4 family metallopeptidase, partial [Acidobacteria bacterium]|nr:M4 family metallopeptidase [Acidobacteriota bacterium]